MGPRYEVRSIDIYVLLLAIRVEVFEQQFRSFDKPIIVAYLAPNGYNHTG